MDRDIIDFGADLFRALGNKKRLEIVFLLIGNELSVTEIMKKVKIGQSSLSQHLGILRKENIVKTRREAQTIYYSIACKKTVKIISVLEEVAKDRY